MLLFGWLVWLILKVCQWPRPSLPTMLIYSVSVAIALDLQLPTMRVCGAFIEMFGDKRLCPDAPWQRFFSDNLLWFVVIYVVMKLISRINRNQYRKIGVQP